MAAQGFLTRTEVVLASNDVHRLGQAQETFEVETQQQETFASKLGKQNSWMAVETIESITQKFDKFQKDRTLTSNTWGFQEKAANVGGSGSENEVTRVFTKIVGGQQMKITDTGPTPTATPTKRRRATIDRSTFRRTAQPAKDETIGAVELVCEGAEDEEDENDEPDYTAILEGTCGDLGREMRGAESRWEQLEPGDEKKSQRQTLDLTRACLNLQPAKARTLDSETIKKHVKMVELRDVKIPKTNM